MDQFLLCLLFTVLAWFLALLSPFRPISLVGQISIPEMHPNVLSFNLIFWAEGVFLLLASQNFPGLSSPFLSMVPLVF